MPTSTYSPAGLEFYGKVSFLKAGLRYADRVLTVSESYAQEILISEFGCGLEGVLRERADCVFGILNGADYEAWDPRSDAWIAARYGADDLCGKASCKQALRAEVGLRPAGNAPLLGYLSRLTHQKMADVVVAAVPEILRRGTQLVVLGPGDRTVEAVFAELTRRFAGELAVHAGYDESLAHRLLAGADILLAPARFEPCGLTQMYALRYGTVPVVSCVGGLKETVVDVQTNTLASGAATGFVFNDRTYDGLLAAIDRALIAYRDRPLWHALQRNGMRADFSWETAARRYLSVYDEVAGSRVRSAISADIA